MFTVDDGHTKLSATPAKVLLFARGRSHRIGHPAGGGDRSLFVSMHPDVLEPFLDEKERFRHHSIATGPTSDLLKQGVVRAARGGRLTPLDLESFVSEALNSRMRTAEVSIGAPQLRLIRDTEEFLSIHFRSDCGLSTMARAVGASPHHLSRLFKRVTGESLSRRRMRLRLAHALDQIGEGADDLSRVAVEAGFYDHSHMTNSFRNNYGLSPSAARSGVETTPSANSPAPSAG